MELLKQVRSPGIVSVDDRVGPDASSGGRDDVLGRTEQLQKVGDGSEEGGSSSTDLGDRGDWGLGLDIEVSSVDLQGVFQEFPDECRGAEFVGLVGLDATNSVGDIEHLKVMVKIEQLM